MRILIKITLLPVIIVLSSFRPLFLGFIIITSMIEILFSYQSILGGPRILYANAVNLLCKMEKYP